MNEALSKMECVACEPGEPTVTQAEIAAYLPQIADWQIVEDDGIRKLRRPFTFEDFAGALQFANCVGGRAEEEGHHPAILVEWGRATVSWWTHVLPDLHRNDFVMAAR